MHACRACVQGCACVILRGGDEQRELGVRIVNLKVSHIMSFIYPAPPPLHRHTCTNTHIVHLYPSEPFIPIFRIINQLVLSYFASLLLFLSICGLHHCHPLVVKQWSQSHRQSVATTRRITIADTFVLQCCPYRHRVTA